MWNSLGNVKFLNQNLKRNIQFHVTPTPCSVARHQYSGTDFACVGRNLGTIEHYKGSELSDLLAMGTTKGRLDVTLGLKSWKNSNDLRWLPGVGRWVTPCFQHKVILENS